MAKRFSISYHSATTGYGWNIETDSIKEMFLTVNGFRYDRSRGYEQNASIMVYDNQVDDWVFLKSAFRFDPQISRFNGLLSRYQKYYLEMQQKARNDAIDWQYAVWSNEESSFDELQEGYERFKKLGKRFGLVQEFRENAII